MVTERQSLFGHKLLLTAIGLFLMVVILNYQAPPGRTDEWDAGLHRVSLSTDPLVLVTLLPVYAAIFLKRAWTTLLGTAACFIMLCGAAGWLTLIVQHEDIDTTAPVIKTATAIGCFLLASGGLLLRIAKVNVDLMPDAETAFSVSTRSALTSLDPPPDPPPGGVTRSTKVLPMDQNAKGVTYHSLDEMPPALREQVEKMLRDQGISPDEISTNFDLSKKTYTVVDDFTGEKHVYESMDDMPPDVRRMFDQHF